MAGQGDLSTWALAWAWAYIHVVGTYGHMHDCMGCVGLDSSRLIIHIHMCNDLGRQGPNYLKFTRLTHSQLRPFSTIFTKLEGGG